MDSDAELLQLMESLKFRKLVVDYAYISAAAILFYEYLSTLGLEISLIWCSQWNHFNVLFLITRYTPILETIVVLRNQLSLTITEHTCIHTFPACSWMLLGSMFFAQVILAIRTWAVWGRDVKLGVCLILLLSGCLVPQAIFVNRFIKTLTFFPRPYLGYRGCFATGRSDTSKNVWFEWIILAASEGVLFIPMAVSGFQTYKLHGKNSLLETIHRDGILFYVYILAVTVANVVIISVLPPDVSTQSGFRVGYTLYSVLTARIVFNIKSVGRKALNIGTTELPHHYPQQQPTNTVIFADFDPNPSQTSTPYSGTKGSSDLENVDMELSCMERLR